MWDLVSFAKAKTRRACLKELVLGPRTPGMIAKQRREHLSHISRAIRELGEKGLVECLTPDRPKNRIYRITKLGKDVIKRLEKVEGAS